MVKEGYENTFIVWLSHDSSCPVSLKETGEVILGAETKIFGSFPTPVDS
jgi:hypothetical protein